MGLEHMAGWVKKYQEPDYMKMASDMKVLRTGARQLKANLEKATDELKELKAETEELRRNKEGWMKEKEAHVEEIRRERERNEIAFATWQEQRSALETKLKKSQVEHQRIKDDLDVQLRKALHENIALQDSAREQDNRLEELERELVKAAESFAVQAEVRTDSVPEKTESTEDWRKRAEQLEKKLQSLGRYNQELLDKYEPTPASDGEEDDTEENEEEEQLKQQMCRWRTHP